MWLFVCKCVYECGCLWLFASVLFVCVCGCVWVLGCLCGCMWVCFCMCLFMCVCIVLCVCVCMFVCVCVYVCVCVCVVVTKKHTIVDYYIQALNLHIMITARLTHKTNCHGVLIFTYFVRNKIYLQIDIFLSTGYNFKAVLNSNNQSCFKW